MKELSTEEKVKLIMDYEKKNKDDIRVIKQALRQLAANGVPVGNMIEAIKDIEEKYAERDERIINLLKMVVEKWHNVGYADYVMDIPKSDILSWLERQGEHANFLDKIQIGDKVTRNEDGVLVNLSQLNRVAKKQGEQTPAWSEEDEKTIDEAVGCLENYAEYVQGGFSKQHVLNLASRVESLKGRYTWKPSDSQLHYLHWIANIKLGDSVVEQEVSKHLNGLLEDLKKLK